MWIEACRGLAEMAEVDGRRRAWPRRRAPAAERTRAAVEKTYWLAEPRLLRLRHRAGRPRRSTRRRRGRAARRARPASTRCAGARSSTRTPCCPRCRCGGARSTRSARRAQIDHLGLGGHGRRLGPAADLGRRAGSTTRCRTTTGRCGRSSRAGRRWPATGTAARTSATRRLMANALLTFQGALGYVTELLSGDFNAPFGRSSHHQVWSEAMVVTPAAARPARPRGARRRAACSPSRRSCRRTGTAWRSARWPPAVARRPHARARPAE